jgi:archaetidylinositol phosphate synthase
LDTAEKHTRINDTLLGPLERPALKWMAAHSPAWMKPDTYTAIGILGSIVILIGYVLSRYHPAYFWLATFGYFLNWVGDSLDGTLARYRHIERPVYGFYIDHVTDAAMQVLIFLGLGLSPYINFDIAILTLVTYLLLSILVYVRTCVVKEFKISYSKLGPTEVRVLAILLNTAMFFFGDVSWPIAAGALGTLTLNPYNLALAAVALLILYFFVSTAVQEGRRLAKAGY